MDQVPVLIKETGKMSNPKKLWIKKGLFSWIATIPKLTDCLPECILPRAFRMGFKAGVKAANQELYEKLEAEKRQN